MAKKPVHPKAKGKKELAAKKKAPIKKKEIVSERTVSTPKTNEDNANTWSKSKKKRMRMMRSKLGKNPKAGKSVSPASKPISDTSVSPSKSAGKGKKSTLQDAFKARLSGSRFRTLNEELYTTTSQESYKRFSENPELFEQYHEGFRHQVESWPVNPVDVMVQRCNSIQQKQDLSDLPLVVADFGCGDAQLAKDLLKIQRQGKTAFTVHSFDLVAPNELVTACDMSNVPIPNKSVDICVFCLSLMGTNLADFVREAHRVLKDDGVVQIAEVRSRIEYSHSNTTKQDTPSKEKKSSNAGTLVEFVKVLEQLGFKCKKTDRSNKMFLLLDLKKSGKAPNKNLAFSAKPCIYKRR
eukprot:Nitzschia sp. Nitz4//scaffold21_size171442//16628//17683//NITZ4_002142-RA/size171442-processed-gene-0.3-mRNA-1//1//CDS//3329542354//8390//frame0